MQGGVFSRISEIEKDYIIVPRKLFLQLLEQDKANLAETDKLNREDPDLHLKVRAIRKTNKVSQVVLATKAQLRQPDISSFENGDEGFSVERRDRIILALEELVQR